MISAICSNSWSSRMLAPSPRVIARSPGACGERSSVSVSAARTISASFANPASSRWYFSRNASKLQSGPAWLSSTRGMSKGTAPSRWATASTCEAGTYRISASESMNRLISHGQASRSIFGRSRVTHFMTSLLCTDVQELSMGGIAAYEESRFRRHKYNAFVMRFTDQVPSQAGFGLGDAHVASIARLHGFGLALDDREAGCCIELECWQRETNSNGGPTVARSTT